MIRSDNELLLAGRNLPTLLHLMLRSYLVAALYKGRKLVPFGSNPKMSCSYRGRCNMQVRGADDSVLGEPFQKLKMKVGV